MHLFGFVVRYLLDSLGAVSFNSRCVYYGKLDRISCYVCAHMHNIPTVQTPDSWRHIICLEKAIVHKTDKNIMHEHKHYSNNTKLIKN